jgi:hypothetical protein
MKFFVAGISIENNGKLSFKERCDLLIKFIPSCIADCKNSLGENAILIIVLHEYALTEEAINQQSKAYALSNFQAALNGEENVILIPGSFANYKIIESIEKKLKKAAKIQEKYSFLNSFNFYQKEKSEQGNKIYFKEEEANFIVKKELLSTDDQLVVFLENSSYILTHQQRVKHIKSFPINENKKLPSHLNTNYIYNIGKEREAHFIQLKNGNKIDLRVLICLEHLRTKEADSQIEGPLVEVIISEGIKTVDNNFIGALCIHMDSWYRPTVKINLLHEKAKLIQGVELFYYSLNASGIVSEKEEIFCDYFENSNGDKKLSLG